MVPPSLTWRYETTSTLACLHTFTTVRLLESASEAKLAACVVSMDSITATWPTTIPECVHPRHETRTRTRTHRQSP